MSYFKTREAAQTAATAARARLPKSQPWKIRVWNNIGWHYALHLGPITVYSSYGNLFHTLIAGDITHTSYGAGEWSWIGGAGSTHARTPLASVRKAVANVKAYFERQKLRLADFDALFTKHKL
jgi:hypothetical protein